MNLDKYDLGKYDFILVIDRSGSMERKDCPGGITRWQQAHDWSKSIAEICSKYDDDGLDVVLFDNSIQSFTNVGPSEVDTIFRQASPRGSTDTAQAIRAALPEYFKSTGLFGMGSKKVSRKKPVIVLVFTDGQPDSESDVKDAIIKITKKISSRQEVGISFLQVGSDASARRFLKSLDDDLESQGAVFDIVDTKNFDELQNGRVEDILIGALTD